MNRSTAVLGMLVVVSLLIGAPLGAQDRTNDAESDAAAKLAGKTSREWLRGDVRIWMGGNTRCEGGERYRFNADKTFEHESCIEGQVQNSRGEWSLAFKGPLDIFLSIEGNKYLLLFKGDGQDSTPQLMTLRKPPSTKTDPVVDRDFSLSED